jgi:hypothetical protein
MTSHLDQYYTDLVKIWKNGGKIDKLFEGKQHGVLLN